MGSEFESLKEQLRRWVLVLRPSEAPPASGS
jgi:hypothetical protein